jgi:hypothetical protein
MVKPKKKPTVKLVGNDGNAFSIMGNVTKELRKAGADKEYINEYMEKAMSGDYNNLLAVTMNYVNVK